MAFKLVCDDVFNATAPAILLTIDGTAKGLYGNVSHAFQRRWPEEFASVARAIRYPLPLGRAQVIRAGGESGFAFVIVASTLHHVGLLDAQEKTRVARMALRDSLVLAHRHGVTELATTILQGGWRLSARAALDTMRQCYQASIQGVNVDLHVYVKDPSILAELSR